MGVRRADPRADTEPVVLAIDDLEDAGRDRSVQTILIVEDDDEIRESLQIIVEAAGYPTVLLSDGQRALDYLRDTPTRPALMLLDLMMPGVDGWTVLHQLQRDGFPLARVLVLTAATSTYLPADVAVLTKPIARAIVLDLIERRCDAI